MIGMNKIISRILVSVLLITSVFAFSACGSGTHKPITSNWKFDQLTADGKKSKASDFNENDIPMIIIDEDRMNQGFYYVTYRQNGKNHNGIMTVISERTYSIGFTDSDNDMTARVDGSKLTLTVDGNKNYSIIFIATEEETLIPADDIEGPDYIKVRMTGNCTVELTNEGNTYYNYGHFYKLEIQKDGKWYNARYVDHFAWTAIGIFTLKRHDV